MPTRFRLKRLYEDPDESDGTRILVDGLWPRGIRRTDWPEGTWRPDLAPSRALRRWFGHDTERFEEFGRRYRAELDQNPGVAAVLEIEGPITLITATRDPAHSHAAVLRDYLEEANRGRSGAGP